MACHSWLPGNTAVPPLAQGALADMVDGWSKAWFAYEPVRALGLLTRVVRAPGELRKTMWEACDDGLAIGMPPLRKTILGAKALGIARGGAERPATDLALLDSVGGDCLEDLKRRSATLFGIEKPVSWRACDGTPHGDPAYRIEIADTDRSLVLALELSADCFTRFVRAWLPAPPAARKFGSPLAALGGLPVTLSVAVGRCELTVAELSSLALGDVLILDRALDAVMPLAIEGSPARRGACTLAERGDRIALHITEALAA